MTVPAGLDITFHRLLVQAIEDMEIDKLGILKRGEVSDFAAYKEQAGYLQALEDVRQVAGEIETKLLKG